MRLLPLRKKTLMARLFEFSPRRLVVACKRASLTRAIQLLLNPLHFRYLNELHDQGNCLVVLLIVASCCLAEWHAEAAPLLLLFEHSNRRGGEKRRQQRPDLRSWLALQVEARVEACCGLGDP